MNMAKSTKKAATAAAAAPKPAAKKVSRKKKPTLPEKFTALAVAQFLAEKHELTKKKVKELLDDFFDIVEGGIMAGERVPMGKIGKAYVKVKPARKSRKGRNPRTGEEITIPAKKASKAPKFNFSKGFKEAALKAKILKKK